MKPTRSTSPSRARIVVEHPVRATRPWKPLALSAVFFAVLCIPTPSGRPLAAWTIDGLRALAGRPAPDAAAPPYSGLPTGVSDTSRD